MISRKLKVIEDRKDRIAHSELRLKGRVEMVQKEAIRRREEAVKAKAAQIQ